MQSPGLQHLVAQACLTMQDSPPCDGLPSTTKLLRKLYQGRELTTRFGRLSPEAWKPR